MGYAWKCLGLAVGLHEDFAYLRSMEVDMEEEARESNGRGGG